VAELFPGFRRERVQTSGAEINLVLGGAGPPVLLLHGYPQTHAMWHRVAPALAERFTVVACDLRGYGDSSKPPGGDDHAAYSKRALAQDQVEALEALGFRRFALVGHDRGARVGHRLALDQPQRVERLALLDIVPTSTVFAQTDKDVATGLYHWFFLSQPYDLPERLIGSEPSFFLRWHLRSWSGGDDSFFAPEAVAEYERCFRDPRVIHASCEDYRAAASIDLRHDEEDAGRRIACPVLVLWGGRGRWMGLFDVLAVWRERADDVRGRALPCGHFLAEELPDETADELLAFLAEE
jgi:haloacetate dehalogenase